MATLPHHDLDEENESPTMPAEQPVEPEMDVGLPIAPEEEDEATRVPK